MKRISVSKTKNKCLNSNKNNFNNRLNCKMTFKNPEIIKTKKLKNNLVDNYNKEVFLTLQRV